MKIYIGSDHGGFELKEELKIWLKEKGYNFEDLGAHSLVSDDDYPDYAFAVANKVASEKDNVGVLLCRSGGGMAVAANKVKGIRAVSIHDKKSAVHAREHDGANIISIPADWISEDKAEEVLSSFLKTSFSEAERHIRRINKIAEFEL